MGYIYTGLWFVAAILLLVRFRKESRIIYVLSGYFFYAGCWWLANQLLEIDLMAGVYGWIFRGISAVMLVALGVVYLTEKRSRTAASSEEADTSEQCDA